MPQEIENSDGTKTTVYTQDDLDAKAAEATAPLQEQIAKTQADLEAAKENLAKAGDKDHNFGELRQKVADLEKKNTDLGGSIETATKAAVLNASVNTAIDRLAEGNKDVKDKIEYHYKRLIAAGAPKDEAEAAKIVRDAYSLSTAHETAPNTLGSIVSSAGGGPTGSGAGTGGNVQPFNETQRAVAASLGITEEDSKKYPPGSVPVSHTKSK